MSDVRGRGINWGAKHSSNKTTKPIASENIVVNAAAAVAASDLMIPRKARKKYRRKDIKLRFNTGNYK